MNAQIEQLKQAIAADATTAGKLEIEDLAARLQDLTGVVNAVSQGDQDPEVVLETILRSYWGAMILARKAIEKAEDNRKRAEDNARAARNATARLDGERKRNGQLANQLALMQMQITRPAPQRAPVGQANRMADMSLAAQ